MIFRKLTLLITPSTLIALMVGCNGRSNLATQAPTQVLTPTPPAATSAPPRGAPTEAPPPVINNIPPQIVGGSATRVSFATDATSARASGNLAAHGTARYVVHVAAGQLIEVSTDGATQPQIAVTGADGKAPKNVLNNAVSFRGAVPTTQDYTITLTGSDQPLIFNLNIVIPERITLAQDATQVNVSGKVNGNDSHQYVINVAVGQLLDLEFSTRDGIHTQVYGVDGDVMQSGMGGGAGFRGVVPTTQDYIVQVIPEGKAVTYTINVIVPQRITFAAGAVSVTLSGSLAASSVRQFVIQANGGQTLDVTWTPDGSAKMSIYGVDGVVLWSGMGEGTRFNGKLPTTQMYFIAFQAAQSAVQFQLVVSIQ